MKASMSSGEDMKVIIERKKEMSVQYKSIARESKRKSKGSSGDDILS
jgi:hypothetical protein